MSLYSDRPIGDVKDDELEVSAFARMLVRPLVEWSSEDPLVMAIYGPWGHGKSSALNLLTSELRDWQGSRGQRAIVVSFNPWLYENTNALLASFFGEIGRAIGTSNALTDDERSGIRDAVLAFGELAVPILSAIPHTMFAGALLGKGIEKIKDLLSKKASDLETKRRDAQNALRSLGKRENAVRVVVLVDDLDRLENPELRMMLRLVKLVADLPNVSYVLAVDHGRLRDVMATDEDAAFGLAFLEKVVQVPIYLPLIPESTLERLVKKALNDVLRDAKLPQDLSYSTSPLSRYLDFYSKTLGRRIRTLRDRARLVNTLRVMLLAGDSPLEVHQVDAVLVAFLLTFYPEAYERVRKSKQFLTEGESIEEWTERLSRRDDDPGIRRKKRFLQLASGYPAFDWSVTTDNDLRSLGITLSDVDVLERVLGLLFPRAVTGRLPSDQEARELRLSNRVQMAERFDRYFYLRLPSDEVRDESVVELLSGLLSNLALGKTAEEVASSLSATLTTLDDGQRRSFVGKVVDRLDSVPAPQRVSLLEVILRIQDNLEVGEVFRIVDVVAESFGHTREPASKDTLVEQAVNAIRHGVRLFKDPLNGVLLAAEYRERDIGALRMDEVARRAIAMEGLDRMKEYLDKGRNIFDDLPAMDAGNVIWRWRDLLRVAGEDFEGIRLYLRRILVDDVTQLPNVLSLFGTWSVGDRPEESRPGLDPMNRAPKEVLEAAEQVVGVEELTKASRKFTDTVGQTTDQRDPFGLVRRFQEIIRLTDAPRG